MPKGLPLLLSLFFVISSFAGCMSFDEEEVVVVQNDNYSCTIEYYDYEIEYFLNIAMGTEFGGEHPTQKWHEDIKIKINGNATVEDLEQLNRTIQDINQLQNTIELSIVENDENVNIYFTSFEEYNNTRDDDITNYSYNIGLFSYHQLDNIIFNGSIWVSPTISQSFRNHTLREEVTQILGLGNDSSMYYNSIFYEVNGTIGNVTEYSVLDQTIISILYRKDIIAGMSSFEVTEVINPEKGNVPCPWIL